MPSTHLLADLGATNSRFAIAAPGGRPRHFRIFQAAEFAAPLDCVKEYLAELAPQDRPHSGALAVAAPIVGGRIRFVNLGWSFSVEGLRRALRFTRLRVLNDLEAQAYAFTSLPRSAGARIGGGRPTRSAPALVVGPGTGLGMACLVSANGRPQVIASEGGHATLAATGPGDNAIIEALRRRYGHASAERALSGPGLAALYHVLKPSAPRSSPSEIAARARARSDSHAVAAATVFSRLLGGFCGDMALAFGALGGVYLVGGVVPGLGRAFDRKAFRTAFEAKGRYREYLARVPVSLVARKDLGLTGLAAYLAAHGGRSSR